MKKSVLQTLIVLTALMLGVSTFARAETIHEVKADIPFAFTAGHTHLPPGDYILTWDNQPDHVLELVSADGANVAAARFESVRAENLPAHTDLVFDKIGKRRSLDTIWWKGSTQGLRLVSDPGQPSDALMDDGLPAAAIAVGPAFHRAQLE